MKLRERYRDREIEKERERDKEEKTKRGTQNLYCITITIFQKCCREGKAR